MLHPLDAIALASLDEGVLVKKLAALWCRHWGNSAPTSGPDILDWVREDYGDLLKKGRDRAIGLALGAEVKRQLAVRKRRKEALEATADVLRYDLNSEIRNRDLLDRVLGAPRKWISQMRTAPGAYANYCITSGLVAALIPTTFRLRALRAPALMVYRQPGDRARSYLVPGGLTTLTDVLIWLIPEKAHRYVKTPGVRVEHDGKRKKVRLILPDGSIKKMGWRKVREG